MPSADPTAPSDADLIARLRRWGVATTELAADRIEELLASQKHLVEKVNDWFMRARTAEARLAEVERQRDRAEQCIEQVRAAHATMRSQHDYDVLSDALAAYDAARETPAADAATDAAWDFPGNRGHLDQDGKLSDPYDKDPETVDPVRGRATSWTASEHEASTAPAEPEDEL